MEKEENFYGVRPCSLFRRFRSDCSKSIKSLGLNHYFYYHSNRFKHIDSILKEHRGTFDDLGNGGLPGTCSGGCRPAHHLAKANSRVDIL